MRKSILIAGLALMVFGVLLSAIPVSTPYSTEVPYDVAIPEYKSYLVGTIRTLGGPVRIGLEHRIVDVSIEYGLITHKLTIWNEEGQRFIYNYVTDYDLDWQQVQVGVRHETKYRAEIAYREEHPFAMVGIILFLIGIPSTVYGAAAKPIEVEYKPPTRPILCPHCQALLPEEGDYCIRCGRKIMRTG